MITHGHYPTAKLGTWKMPNGERDSLQAFRDKHRFNLLNFLSFYNLICL